MPLPEQRPRRRGEGLQRRRSAPPLRRGPERADIDPAVTSRPHSGVVNPLVEWYRPRCGINADAVRTIGFAGPRAA